MTLEEKLSAAEAKLAEAENTLTSERAATASRNTSTLFAPDLR